MSISTLLQKEVQQAITKSQNYLFSIQQPQGFWKDYVASSAVATPAALYALYHADPQRFKTVLSRGCAWLRETQHEEGGWGDAVTDASTLNATALSVSALKLIEPEKSALNIKRALAYIDARGGYATIADPKECSMYVACLGFLALAGLYEWKRIPRIPLELVLLPKSFWMRFSCTMPAIFSWGLIQSRKLAMSPPRRWLNKLLRPRVLKWLESSRAANGCWQGSPLMTGLASLGLVIGGGSYERVAPSLAYLLATQRADGSWSGAESLDFSVTTFILGGLEGVGMLGDARLKPTQEWMLASQHDRPYMTTGCPGGWWSWLLSGWPDTDDTAGGVVALRHLGVPADELHIQKGCDWLCKMQNRDGSWGMFIKNCNSPMDGPCPALTARAILALHDCHEAPEPMRTRYATAIEHALIYLQQVQRDDGAIHNLWYRTLVYGVASVLEVYATLNRVDDPVACKCQEWLLTHQRMDGSWGEDEQQAGTIEETAWALAALTATQVNAPDEPLDRAASWIVRQQRDEGSWAPNVIGYYAAALQYSSDHIANGFALRALGRYHRLRER
jgi:squalene-hopene/tetraprenyl-beta-curcumene cyclase